MSLRKELEESGMWLFKYRSYLPLIILPLLFYSLQTPFKMKTSNILLIIGLTVSYLGEFIRIITIAFVPIGTSGRNTVKQIAASLNTKGIYSTVRHPLYLGNFLIYLGPFIYTGNIYAIIIFILIFWIYYERIMFAEESYLSEKFSNEYLKWSEKTPTFIPNIILFSSINSKFSIKKVLHREYSGIFGIIIIFTCIVSFRNYLFNLTPILSTNWIIILLFNTIIYIYVRLLKIISYKR